MYQSLNWSNLDCIPLGTREKDREYEIDSKVDDENQNECNKDYEKATDESTIKEVLNQQHPYNERGE